MYDGVDMSALVGRTILALWVSDDERILAFSTNLGPVAYYADGDCCSESWFADITGVKALLGHVVTAAEVIDMATVMPSYNLKDGRGRQDVDEAYGFKLTTDKGVVDIIFRNSSNGYYSGTLELWSPLHHSNGEDPKGARIVDDWQAGAKPAEAGFV